ncbi:MAG: ElyC/SanA/YdcF family protein [Coleofasciculus sp. D1-CHI-01]|uniref:YdcF family protein n=1 Tax=Coleofasciculus sp. D1-CHI-01 TaxID=3068482 RepID=UPI0032F989C5
MRRLITRHWLGVARWLLSKQRLRWLGLGLLSLVVILSIGLLSSIFRLSAGAAAPVDTFFVLGGSIRREVYVTQLVKQHPQTPVLISQGSDEPCILLIFQKYNAPMGQVWLEKCADSTFGNFYFGIPILRQWGVRHVQLITSPTHLPRAGWMAQILLGANGIWVDVDTVQEKGIPGNQESWWKTGLDVTRSLVWALLSQGIQPHCSEVTPLTEVDLDAWQKSGFDCEYQWWLKLDY